MVHPANGGSVRWNFIATCATCTTRWPMARQRIRNMCVTFDGPSIPFGAAASPSFRKNRQGCMESSWDMYYLQGGRRGLSGDLLIADCEDLENLSASNIHVKRFKQIPNTSVFLNHHAAKCPPGETLSKMKKLKRTPFS